MESRTIYLSRLLGLYCIGIGCLMFFNPSTFVAAIEAIARDPAWAFLWGMVAMTVGLAMVLAHTRWSGGLPAVLVTLIGWLSLIKGLAILFLVPSVLPAYITMFHVNIFSNVYAAVLIVLGAYLTYAGFTSTSKA